MIQNLTCFKCHHDTAVLTYEENRLYKVACPCGCEYFFEHSSMDCAKSYHMREVELHGEIDRNADLSAQLTEKDKQLGAAVEKAKLWGTDLIESNSDARATICAECGFPIPDYSVNEEIWCSWCKAKNSSDNYVPAGPGYCKTTLDRKAKTFDRLCHSGCRVQGEAGHE